MSNEKSISHAPDTTAEELRDFDWCDPSSIVPNQTDGTPNDPSLKQRYQEIMLARYPEFEAQTATDITELKHEVSRLSDMNKVMVWLLLGVMLIQGIAQLN